MNIRKIALAGCAILVLGGLIACTKPANKAAAPEAAAVAAPVSLEPISAPAGVYAIDPDHASVAFRVNHLGFSFYNARFKRFTAEINFDAANPGASTVTASIDPTSIETDYAGDYAKFHQGSPFKSFNEDLANNQAWFNAKAFPKIDFVSTALEVTGGKAGKMTGNLTLLGVTKPVTFDVTLVGSAEKHPILGVGVLGFNARTTIKRSDFGMTNYVPNVGDDVEIIIDGEFEQKPAS